MMRCPALLRLTVLAGAALGLSACITLLPKSEPATLYRFGQNVGEVQVGAAPAEQVRVYRTASLFQRESAGDRLLTITSGRAAYVADTRWVAPATILWDEAVLAAFDADPGPTRLVLRGEPAGVAAYILRLDVRNFEALYENGPKAAPTVLVRVRATITRNGDHNLISERIFERRITAGDNRVRAIVPAYDRAVSEVIAEVVAWTNEQAKPV